MTADVSLALAAALITAWLLWHWLVTHTCTCDRCAHCAALKRAKAEEQDRLRKEFDERWRR